MEITTPIHELRPSEQMKAKGFTQDVESVHIQIMTTGKLAVFPTSVFRKERPYPYAVFKNFDEIKKNFEVLRSTNSNLK